MQSPFRYVPGCTVTYKGPTDHKGSQWIATIKRGSGAADRFRVAVSYQDGPDAAARAVVERFNDAMGANWVILGAALSMDGGDSYAYPVGPTELVPVISLPSV